MSNPNYKYENGKIKIQINNQWIEPHFKHYEDLEPLGEPGANGVVLKGTHKVTKRVDAIKIWLPRRKGSKNEINQNQYLAEVQKIAKLKDPRIATIYDAWTENECYCSSMEFIDGVTYKIWLEQNSDILKRIDMLLKIFEAIISYQSQGFIHGDIHTQNIMVGKDESVHIIDFGTSCISSYEGQSTHRENFLMYELVERTLANVFNKNAFIYKKYALNSTIKNINDIRKATPIFFSKSIQSYLQLISMLIRFPTKLYQPDYICKYCNYIIEGMYLNYDYFYGCLPTLKDKPVIFKQTMSNLLEDKVYKLSQYKDNEYDDNEYEKMKYITLFFYFHEVKQELLEGKISKENLQNPDICKKFCISNNIIDIIILSDNLFEFHNTLTKSIKDYDIVYIFEMKLRDFLYTIIKETHKDDLLSALENLNLYMENFKSPNELCDKIAKLSYIYCINNDIDLPPLSN